VEGERVRLIDLVAVFPGKNRVFVYRSGFQIRNEPFPNAGFASMSQRVAVPVPLIEISHDTDPFGVRRPNPELSAPLPIVIDEVRSQFFVEALMGALIKKMEIIFGQESVVPEEERGGGFGCAGFSG